ncbi:hypothetical protein LV78_005306 [Actinosynnema pretiosum]|nr:hypothetical protein [Actinosynnema pretiosum]
MTVPMHPVQQQALRRFHANVEAVRTSSAVDDPQVAAMADALELLARMEEIGLTELRLPALADVEERMDRLREALDRRVRDLEAVAAERAASSKVRELLADRMRGLPSAAAERPVERAATAALGALAESVRAGAAPSPVALRRIGTLVDLLSPPAGDHESHTPPLP